MTAEVQVVEIAGWRSHLVIHPGQVAIVDPGLDGAAVIDAARRAGPVAAVVQTGVAETHVTRTAEVAEAVGVTPLAARGTAAEWDRQPLDDGPRTLGGAPVEVLVEPAAARLAVLLGDRLLTGQALPVHGPPTDFLRTPESLARAVRLAARLAAFPPDTLVLAADAPPMPLGDLLRANPLLRLPEPELLEIVCEQPPPRPLNAEAIVATNLGQVDMAWAMPLGEQPVSEIEPAALARRLGSPWEPRIVDLRESREQADGVIEGSVRIPQAALASRLTELMGDREITLVSQRGGRARRAVSFLVGAGFPLSQALAGGIEAWSAAGLPLRG